MKRIMKTKEMKRRKRKKRGKRKEERKKKRRKGKKKKKEEKKGKKKVVIWNVSYISAYNNSIRGGYRIPPQSTCASNAYQQQDTAPHHHLSRQ